MFHLLPMLRFEFCDPKFKLDGWLPETGSCRREEEELGIFGSPLMADRGFEGRVGGFWLLLFNMCVKISFVYFRRFVISALLLSSAWFKGMVDLSPFLLT